mmetsp:Transcript_1483/g.3349  ORF Transcript_1483/g.3349 Transcript_1483/m.3349 type:complete len:242 (-) Transcript_1483:37-762(-)
MWQGLTTYDYIISKRQAQDDQEFEGSKAPVPSASDGLHERSRARVRFLPSCMDWIIFSRCGQRRKQKPKPDAAPASLEQKSLQCAKEMEAATTALEQSNAGWAAAGSSSSHCRDEPAFRERGSPQKVGWRDNVSPLHGGSSDRAAGCMAHDVDDQLPPEEVEATPELLLATPRQKSAQGVHKAPLAAFMLEEEGVHEDRPAADETLAVQKDREPRCGASCSCFLPPEQAEECSSACPAPKR